MRAIHTTALTALAALYSLGACGGPKPLPEEVRSAVWRPPLKQSVYLRAAFDDDPSAFIGRFLPAGVANDEVDETRAAQTRCSKYIAFKTVNAGGSFDESFQSTSAIRASLGATAFGTAKGGHGADSSLRVRYKLAKIIRGEISDPDGFSQCCRAAPDQCPNKYVGEFIFGSGEVMQYAGSQAEVQAGGRYQVVEGELDFKHGTAWKRLTSFENVYFAFRTAAIAESGGDANRNIRCTPDAAWIDAVPQSLDGTYVVGVSRAAASESGARNLAMDDARGQVVKMLGSKIATSSTQRSASLDKVFDNEAVLQAAAAGVAKRVTSQCWKVVQEATPDGIMFKAYALAFFPAAEEKAAALEMTAAVKDRLPVEQRRALEEGAEQMGPAAKSDGGRPAPAEPTPGAPGAGRAPRARRL